MQTRQVKDILDAVPMAVLLVGYDQRIIAANDAAAHLLGPALEGRACTAILRHPDFLNGLESGLAAGRKGTARVLMPGSVRDTHLAVTFSPVRIETGAGLLISFEDLTAFEQAGAMRRDFVANVSHELRTPLTALVGFIETLRGAARDDPEARERFLTIMERESGRMIRLVNDLLSLSRVEAEERRRPSGQVDLMALLRAAIATHRDLAQSAGVRLILETVSDGIMLRADADQLTQVFHNLIENAMKYGASGKLITVRVALLEREPVLRGPAVQVEVIDRGEGIDPLHLPRLTERFYRVDTGRSREKGGTGLGLAIVKHIVSRHRGRFRIESEIGKGSKFIVILPTP